MRLWACTRPAAGILGFVWAIAIYAIVAPGGSNVPLIVVMLVVIGWGVARVLTVPLTRAFREAL